MKKYALPATLAAIAIGALAGCEPATQTSSTTVVKEPVVQKETKEVIVQAPAPAPAEPEKKPETTETTRSSTTTSVDTPAGTATRTDTTTTKTTQ
jgi:hypothetical protein